MRGYFGIGIYHSKREQNIGALMRSAFCFGAAFVFTVGKRYRKDVLDTVDCGKNIPLYHYATVAELKGSLPAGCQLIGIELLDNAHYLQTFCHPAQACYLLGAEDHGLSEEAIRACHHLVVVPGLRMCLNVATAGSLVLYDRSTK